MSDTTQTDPVFILFLGALLGMLPTTLNALINALVTRGLEQEKRLAAVKTRIKGVLRQTPGNADSQVVEALADELDELAQLSSALKRKKRSKNDQEVTSLDLLEAEDMLREVAGADPDAENRSKPHELIEKLKIRLSPHEEQWFQTG